MYDRDRHPFCLSLGLANMWTAVQLCCRHLHVHRHTFPQLVASSLVCLPAVDAGGAGPKAESWAFGTDAEGLRILEGAGVFSVRACKLCNDGIVVQVRTRSRDNKTEAEAVWPVWMTESVWHVYRCARPFHHVMQTPLPLPLCAAL